MDASDWRALLALDQLRAVRAMGVAFHGFQEGDPAFPPTFKVERIPGFSYQAQRVPAYTDRVLWKSMPSLAASVTQTALRAVGGVGTSDHKPVVAEFELRETAVLPRLLAGSESSLAPLVRVSRLRARGLHSADLDGKSDPYCLFYTSPPGLLAWPPPRSSSS